MITITVPAQLVGALRSGLHSEIGNAAEALAQVAGRAGREQHPESYREPLEHLDRTRALLDLIGWSATSPAVAVRVDPAELGRVLRRLRRARRLSIEDLALRADLHPTYISSIERGEPVRGPAAGTQGRTERAQGGERKPSTRRR
jgi:Helix-turn-helix domain